jgi:hypothetical protein
MSAGVGATQPTVSAGGCLSSAAWWGESEQPLGGSGEAPAASTKSLHLILPIWLCETLGAFTIRSYDLRSEFPQRVRQRV